MPPAPSANLPPTLFSLDSAPETDILVPHKLPHYVHPALVLWEFVVEFVRNAVQSRQSRPRDGGEVVVLVVQANVVGEEIEWSIVRVRLREGDLVGRIGVVFVWLFEDVMLGDEMAGTGVQRACEKTAHDKIPQRPSSREAYEGVIEGELGDDVEQVDLGEGQAVDEHGSEGVEEDLEGAEEGLARDRVKEEGLEGGGEIGVEAVDAERLVMRQVVGPKGGAVGDANGQIGKDGEDPVGQRRPEGQVMRDLVDGEEEVLVGSRADNVGREKKRP